MSSNSTDFSSISYLDTFSSWCSLMSCFLHKILVKYNASYLYTFRIFVTNNHHMLWWCTKCKVNTLRANQKPYIFFEMLPC